MQTFVNGARALNRTGDTCVARGAPCSVGSASGETGDTSVAPTLKRLRTIAAIVAITALAATPAHAAGIGGAVDPLVYELAVFALAIVVGFYVVWSVTPALHTPLMSVTNAISSVIVVGALLAVGVPMIASGSWLAKICGVLALAMASVNIFGGFLVTQRMLAMDKRKEK